MLDKGIIPVVVKMGLGWLEVLSCYSEYTSMQCKTYELLISGIFHLIFSHYG
jgi:hypothetical protein